MIAKLLLPLLLLLASPVLSQEVSSSFRDFSLGINDNTTTIALKPNESPDAMNVVIDEPWGNLKTRKGTQTCGYLPSGNQATNAYEYIRSNGNHELIVTDNVTVWSTLNCTDFTQIVTGLSDIAAPYFDTFRDKLWIVNKSTFTITWDGATAVYLDGSGIKPSPVKAQYVTHWKERVWLARTTTEPSAVYFSALYDEGGDNIDPSISSQAWPSANAFYIAQDDGSPIYGMKVFKDNLFIFKETGIWRIIFESVYNTQVVKSVSNVGCKFHDSIVELDNLLYFVGPDGIYKFDGNDVTRISDNITTTFKKLKQPSRLDKFKLWDTPADWVEGTLSSVSTVTYPLSVSLSYIEGTAVVDSFSDSSINPAWTISGDNYFTESSNRLRYITNLNGGQSATGVAVIASTLNVVGSYTTDLFSNASWQQCGTSGNDEKKPTYSELFFVADSASLATVNGYSVKNNCVASPGANFSCTYSLNKYTNGVPAIVASKTTTGTSILDNSGAYFYAFGLQCASNRISITRDGVITTTGTAGLYDTRTTNTSSYSDYCSLSYTDPTLDINDANTNVMVRMYAANTGINNCSNPDATGASVGAISVSNNRFSSQGTFTSQVSTFTNLSMWRTFDVDETLNGQSIQHFVKTGPTPSTLGEFRHITSGAVISTSTADKNLVWESRLTSYSNSKTPTLNAVTVNYQEGDVTATRLSALNYNNRYMVTASTTPANLLNDIVLVKSKSPLDSWMVYDQTISAFTKWNNYLYGGVSNSSDVARMDYGSNDNGKPINAYWTWGDSDMGVGLSYKKTLSEIYAFYVPSLGNNTQLQYSRDGGANWNSLLLNTNTTGSFGTKRLLFNGGNANAFRFRILNNTLDESFNFLGFNAYGTKYMARE